MQSTTINVKIYDLFRTKFALSETDAKEAAQVFEEALHEAKGQMVTKEYLDVKLESKLDSKTFFITAAAQLIITIGALIGIVSFMTH